MAKDTSPLSHNDIDDDIVDLLEVVKPGKPLLSPDAPKNRQSAAGSSSAAHEEEEDSARNDFEEVDLNELDTLLDDMLALAPASGSANAAAHAKGEKHSLRDAVSRLSRLEAMVTSHNESVPPALHAECAAVRGEVEALRQEFEATKNTAAASVSAATTAAKKVATEIATEAAVAHSDALIAPLRNSFAEICERVESIFARLDGQTEDLQRLHAAQEVTTADVVHVRGTAQQIHRALALLQDDTARIAQNVKTLALDGAAVQSAQAEAQEYFTKTHDELAHIQEALRVSHNLTTQDATTQATAVAVQTTVTQLNEIGVQTQNVARQAQDAAQHAKKAVQQTQAVVAQAQEAVQQTHAATAQMREITAHMHAATDQAQNAAAQAHTATEQAQNAAAQAHAATDQAQEAAAQARSVTDQAQEAAAQIQNGATQEDYARLQEELLQTRQELAHTSDVLEHTREKMEDMHENMESIRESMHTMHNNMEKMAAEAAARVIREELTALLQED